jgi:hypothetical protein
MVTLMCLSELASKSRSWKICTMLIAAILIWWSLALFGLNWHRMDGKRTSNALNKFTWMVAGTNPFLYFIERAKCKQAFHDGDRSHDDLRLLDSLCLTYPGWQNDVNTAMETHSIETHLHGYGITCLKFCLTEKQRTRYERCRSKAFKLPLGFCR